MVHARNKGKAGEQEFIETFRSLFPEPIKRNLEQVRSGGSDLIGSDPFVVEIKRVEKLDLNNWWRQVTHAASTGPLCPTKAVPLVAYRQSRQPWKFLLPATLIVAKSSTFIIADTETFIKFITEYYK